MGKLERSLAGAWRDKIPSRTCHCAARTGSLLLSHRRGVAGVGRDFLSDKALKESTDVAETPEQLTCELSFTGIM